MNRFDDESVDETSDEVLFSADPVSWLRGLETRASGDVQTMRRALIDVRASSACMTLLGARHVAADDEELDAALDFVSTLGKGLPGDVAKLRQAALKAAPVAPAAPAQAKAAGEAKPAESSLVDLEAARVQQLLDTTRSGAVKPHMPNVVLILENDRRWRGRFRLDAFAGRVEVHPPPDGRGSPALHTDAHTRELTVWLHRHYGTVPSTEAAHNAILTVAERNRFDPLIEDLTRCADAWDRRPRVRALLAEYFGAADTDLNRELSVRFVVGAVRRAFEPGVKLDTVLTLVGGQGVGKSSGLRALAGPRFYRDSAFDLHSKDALQQIAGVWIYELAELKAFNRREDDAIKAFLSSQVDSFRPPYDRVVVERPRRCVFAGTTNEADFLRDPTGSRRFWPVQVGKVDTAGLAQDREQLWGEAVHLYRAGERHWLDEASVVALQAASRDFESVDPWAEQLGAWTRDRVSFTIADAFEALKVPMERRGMSEGKRVGAILRGLGFARHRARTTGGNRESLWTKGGAA